ATTLASIGDGVILTDAEGRVTFLNTEAERLTGWANSEANEKPLHEVFQIINEETRATVENPVDKVMRLGGVVGLANHTILVSKDGREIPIDDSAAPIRQPGGPLFGVVLVFRDFTERKHAEEALREREERFHRMADSAPVLIWVSGTDKLCTWFNRQWLEFTGRTMEQELGNGWAEGVHEDDFDRCLKTYIEAFEARQSFTMEYRLRRHDGAWRWVLDHGVPIYEATDVFAGYIGTCIDVTDQRNAADDLRAKEAELEAIINRTPFMLTRCTSDLRYRFVSRAYAEMLGRDPRDIAGKPIVQVIGEEGFKTIQPFVERVLLGQHIEYEEAVSFEGVGAPHLRAVYTPDRDAQGKVIGWIASIVDITDRKRAEAEREKMLAREQELRQLAEDANRLKDEFLAIMSHELRNPLNVILGFSELLVRNEEITRAPQLQRMAEAIKRNAIAQSKLIRDLLDLSRLRSGKLTLNRENVSMLVAVNNAIDTVRSEAAAKQIAIEIEAPAETLFVEGDAVRLEQIIWNLMNNSVKFTSAGGRISVRLGKENDRVFLTVEDTGQGIDASFLPHVFELFRQADASTSRAHSGMGIGLAVVKQLVDLHHGSISVYSAGLGKGTTFTVKFPLSLEIRPELAPVIDLTTTLDKFAVLVVDDSEDTTEMLAQVLKMSGAIVSSATSGDEALRIMGEKEFDVILSDISMPGMDGFEFLRNLRQLPGRADVPVLALTGFGRPEDIERAKSEGFFSHVTKPFDIDELIAVLKSLTQKKVH
ncbi:MAG TPA: PAS domain S-box protein, partial [Pyrinomonadaceae bacterium]|nr:PAS domain S-box protein [Pyrinomonadaceae bacterium]